MKILPSSQCGRNKSTKQQGMVVLALSIILLILISAVSIYLARTLLFEQKLTNNSIRAKQAFEAAEAGYAVAQEYFIKGIIDNTAEGKYQIFASIVDGSDDSFRGTLADSSFAVTLTEIDVDGLIAIGISSTGTSADGTASKTIASDVVALNPIPNIPDNPISTKGAFAIGGSGTVHNSEGHSTIWSGGNVDVGSNNSTKTLIADPNGTNYPACMDIPGECATIESSNRDMAGLDIVEHDSDLANLTAAEMFANFFGMTPAAYKETMATRIVDTNNPGQATGDCGNSWGGCVNMALNEVVWYEGNVSENGGSVGCATKVTGNNVCAAANEYPSIVIINGDASFKGTPHFYGILFVMGNVTGTGNMTLHGAMVTAGQANTGNGSLDIYYNSRLLESLESIGPRAISSGSWKDF
ncbi:PilX N-terminal domain-containing pilus assembly protein [Thalassotalea sp. ND16A]|uniref:PilX N-terminal domain-containing pilus assembly protein n=1 Tax=Thalassotalea sp. ND16A TaxID=1535422 RepID=UPI00051A3504|nr:PilX N-terminal domain-containing pilus assembly protein [Thalassotalea sp. ND16A]KGJ88254.1 hypothetical protein ND16A_0194 [Thalassotalea sp. ND16A]